MRHLLCLACAKDKRPGERVAYDSPREYERVVFGTARFPAAEQRVITVTTDHVEKIPLAPDSYDCDGCNKDIKPGERCCAHSAWTDDRVVTPWESEYLDPEVARA